MESKNENPADGGRTCRSSGPWHLRMRNRGCVFCFRKYRQQEAVQEETAQEDMTQGRSGQQEETQTKSTSESGEPDLSGEIREISDQTFVLNEIIEEEGEGGTEIAALPLDEAEMNLITAVWDENTRFTRRAIKKGGADYEDSESSPEALETGAMVNLWGSYEGDVFRASQVRLTEVE